MPQIGNQLTQQSTVYYKVNEKTPTYRELKEQKPEYMYRKIGAAEPKAEAYKAIYIVSRASKPEYDEFKMLEGCEDSDESSDPTQLVMQMIYNYRELR